MATHFHIEGLGVYDGDYPIDLSYFTNRELHLIKEMSGVRAGEIEEAFDKHDNDLVIALAVIALQRAGKVVNRDALWDAQVGKISLVGEEDEVEADAVPPSQPPTEGGSSEENESPGPSSSPATDLPGSVPSRTGIQGSAIGAGSARETSAT